MMNQYQFLRDVCGLDKIVCIGSMSTDTSYWYQWRVSESDLLKMYKEYVRLNNQLWDYLKDNKTEDTVESDKSLTFVKPDDGIYFNAIKLDFERAFTNYIDRIVDINFVNVFKFFCGNISKAYLPRKAKKFLYNYTLTNLLVNLRGKKYLGDLRSAVYEDVLYLSSYIGDIIKSEVDGAYILTDKLKEDRLVNDVYGQFNIQRLSWILCFDQLMIGKRDDGKSILKGLSKDKPNIFRETIMSLATAQNNKDRDEAINSFLYDSNQHALDWCYKSDNGETAILHTRSMEVSLETKTSEDILNINRVMPKLDRDFYLNDISFAVSSIFELIG